MATAGRHVRGPEFRSQHKEEKFTPKLTSKTQTELRALCLKQWAQECLSKRNPEWLTGWPEPVYVVFSKNFPGNSGISGEVGTGGLFKDTPLSL